MAPSDQDHAKQLARKLYWAVSSTFPNLSKTDRSHTFTWAADMAAKILSRIDTDPPSLPPPVDSRNRNGYNGQAVGRGGGRNDPSSSRAVRSLPPPDMPAWKAQQAVMRERAWAHVLKGRLNGGPFKTWDHSDEGEGSGSSNSTG